ncbi:hypothetical protein BU16DRAFT_568240 [Lophium mytilinum]|uniref:Uncharacterized protein n=1 Tax=Lophium mytilinum TaxID=390894 RepID=A0A6A6Q9Q9_9PEZI|nr:hypothetical protein BU16DRAFT_568240 [Lophium mytilinum]
MASNQPPTSLMQHPRAENIPTGPQQPAWEPPAPEQAWQHPGADHREYPLQQRQGEGAEGLDEDSKLRIPEPYHRHDEGEPTTTPEAEALERSFGEDYDPSNAPSPRWADTNIVELDYDPSAPKRFKPNTREIDTYTESRAGNPMYHPDQDPRSMVGPGTDLKDIPLEKGQLWYQCTDCHMFVKVRALDGIVNGEWRVREALKCRACGCKAMYKIRSRRMMQFEAR